MKIGIVCCSDGIRQGYEDEIEELHRTLADMGIESVFSPFLYARDGVASGTAEERAKAGTAYMPDLHGKILLLESRSGTVARMETYLSQLQQIGVFEQIAGILLGTFTEMEAKQCTPDIVQLVKRYAGENMPIAVTGQIGHGTDAKGIVIGAEL